MYLCQEGKTPKKKMTPSKLYMAEQRFAMDLFLFFIFSHSKWHPILIGRAMLISSLVPLLGLLGPQQAPRCPVEEISC